MHHCAYKQTNTQHSKYKQSLGPYTLRKRTQWEINRQPKQRQCMALKEILKDLQRKGQSALTSEVQSQRQHCIALWHLCYFPNLAWGWPKVWEMIEVSDTLDSLQSSLCPPLFSFSVRILTLWGEAIFFKHCVHIHICKHTFWTTEGPVRWHLIDGIRWLAFTLLERPHYCIQMKRNYYLLIFYTMYRMDHILGSAVVSPLLKSILFRESRFPLFPLQLRSMFPIR